MIWDFHGIHIKGASNDERVMAAWQKLFASRPAGTGPAAVTVHLEIQSELPSRPRGEPTQKAPNFIEYYVKEPQTQAFLANHGLLTFRLEHGVTTAQLTPNILSEYGALEDVLSIALAPHLRRRGAFLVHAFGAALQKRGILLVGGMGSGKTTTGIALLTAGWQLLSNDSPLLTEAGIAAYPGELAAFADSWQRFPNLATIGDRPISTRGRPKIGIMPESVWPDVWLEQAPLHLILFPQLEGAVSHVVEPLSPAQTLTLLLPHAVEHWDKVMIPRHLALLRMLVSRAAGFRLRLGSDVAAIPDLIRSLLI